MYIFCGIVGLPWTANRDDIRQFLSDIKHIEDDNIVLCFNQEGRPNGEAFVALRTEEEFNKAKAHNKQHLKNRFGSQMYKIIQSTLQLI